jgi:opacity protein-like surface antigen
MMLTQRFGLRLCVMILVTVAATPADAEWALDVYGGAAWTASTDLDVTGRDDTGLDVSATIFDIDTNTGFTAGARVGYWFESARALGLGLDLFFFSIPIPAQTVTASATFSGDILGKPITFTGDQAHLPQVTLPGGGFSPHLALRWPLLVDEKFPTGRLQPYLTAGPAWAFSLENDEVRVELGGKVGAGLAVQIVRHLSLFVEYRYAFFPSFELVDQDVTYEADLQTQQAVLGLSFRF